MAKLLNVEQHEFILSNAKGITKKQMIELLKNQFGLEISYNQIKSYYRNHKITSGLDMTFKSGGIPAIKGTKGVYNVGGNRTSFRPGNKPKNYRPVGSERVNTDGYIEIKYADPGKWKHKHVWVWEQEHGPIPNGYVVLMSDGNKLNVAIDNLILITRRQLAILNKHRLIQDNKEGTQTGLLISDILLKIGELKRK